MRIAFFGPMPPSNTGIADYDEALLPLLREHYEIDLFTPQSHAHYYSWHKQKPYDLNLYQMGNNAHYHEYIWAYAFQFPGATVFHDYCLHHSRAGMLLNNSHYQEYREELAAVYPQQAEKIGNAVISFAGSNLLFFYFPFFQLLLSSSLAAAAHTDFAVRELRNDRTPVIKIPHLELPARVEIGADPFPDRFVIASFGFATRAKRIPSVLKAIAQLRKRFPQLLYVIVGKIEKRTDLVSQIEHLGLRETVVVTGHVDDAQFLRLMSRADVIVNLRYPSAGEMSGTLVRALACGKPVLISRIASLNEIPEDAALRIRLDHEVEDIIETVTKLIENGSLQRNIGEAARKYVKSHHRPEQAVAKYRELVEIALGRKATFQRPPLPFHLRSSREMLHRYILESSFRSKNFTLVDRIIG